MKRLVGGGSLAMLVALCMAAGALVGPPKAQAARGKDQTGVPYTWASRRIDKELWGMAATDVDGDGVRDVVLLERERILVGRFDGTKFKGSFRCEWEGTAKGARIDMFDLDGDGREEALITAVRGGMPASLALRFKGKGCERIVSDFPMSLRVMELPPKDDGGAWTMGIVAQGASSQEYFTGPIHRVEFTGGKLELAGKLKLPWLTKLYRFAYLPTEDGDISVVRYGSASPLEIRKNTRKNKWRKVWRSPEKYGSSGNLIHAVQRPALDQVQSAYASFELPPTVVRGPASSYIFMVKYDMPLANVVGSKPYIKGSRVFEYRPDPAFIYAEELRTQHMPGDVVDYAMAREGADLVLTVLMQDNRGFFENPTQSMVLKFNLARKEDAQAEPDQSEKTDDR